MYVLGLYSDGDYFKVSLISKRRGKIRIEFIKEFKKSIDNLNALKRILEKKTSFFHPTIEIVSALPSEEVFLRKFMIPLTGDRKVRKALEFQLSSDELYSEEDRYFVPLLKRKGKETEVNLYGYTKEAMEGHLQDVKTLGIDSEWVSTVSRALERFVQFFAIQTESFFLFHLGWESSSMMYFSEGEMKKETSFKIGLKNIIDAVQKDQVILDSVDMHKMQELFIEAIEENKETHATEVFFEVEREISRAWTYIMESEKIALGVNKILFTGYAEFSRELKPYLPPLDLEEIKLLPHLEFSVSQLSSYAIEIGLALDRVVSDKQTLQLGEGRFIPFAQKKKAKKYLSRYVGLSLLSSLMIFFMLNTCFIKKELKLKKRYESAVFSIDGLEGDKKRKISYTPKGMLETKKALAGVIKGQKLKDKIGKGPTPFASLEKFLTSSQFEQYYVDEISYEVVKGPDDANPLQEYIVDVTISFNNPGKTCLDLFKEQLIHPDTKLHFVEEPRISQTGDMAVINMKVSG